MSDLWHFTMLILLFSLFILFHWWKFVFMQTIDRHMQRLLLWGFQTKLKQQAEDVDRELDWLVSHTINMPPKIKLLSFFSTNKNYRLWEDNFIKLKKKTCKFNHRYTEFGGAVPYRPVEDIAYSVARFILKGGSFVNYYMVNKIKQSYTYNYCTSVFGSICVLIYMLTYSIMEGRISTELLVNSWLQAMTTMLLSTNTVLTKLKTHKQKCVEWLTNLIQFISKRLTKRTKV